MARRRHRGPSRRRLEILARLHTRVFELANAVMHTSGQAFVMAFQAGGAHALDRALESIAYSYAEMTRVPATAIWEKPGRDAPIRMEKTFTVVPRGVALVIGCNTFPTWNSWPGLFASLVTGNAVVVKPHPGAVLPLAITVQAARDVLAEAGFDPNLVTLAAEDPADGLAAVLAVRPEVKLVDFTGSSTLRQLARGQRHPGHGLHREVRRQHGRDRLDRLLQVDVLQPRLLVGALHRPDVHDTAEPLHPARRHRDRRRPQVASTTWPRGSAAPSPSSWVMTLGPSNSSAASSTTAYSNVSTRPGPTAGDVADRVPRVVAHPAFADASRTYPSAGACRRRRRVDLRTGVLRSGDLPHHHRLHLGVDRDVQVDRACEHGAMTAAVYSTDSRDVIAAMRSACARRRRRAEREPHRPGVRQPERGVQRLPRHRRQPGRQLDLHRRRLRREPIPLHPIPPPHLADQLLLLESLLPLDPLSLDPLSLDDPLSVESPDGELSGVDSAAGADSGSSPGEFAAGCSAAGSPYGALGGCWAYGSAAGGGWAFGS